MVRSPIVARRSVARVSCRSIRAPSTVFALRSCSWRSACHGPSLQDSSDGDGRQAKAENDGRRLGARPRPAGEKDSTAYERNRERSAADA